MSSDFSKISGNLSLVDGVWRSSLDGNISYPEDGNEGCFKLENDSFWFKHRNKCIVELVKKYPPNGVLFDVGGGNGFVSLGLQESGFDVALVEPGAGGIVNAKSRGVENVICSTFQNAGFVPNSISAIGLFDVLEHIEDDKSFLFELKESLKRQGRLYITVPAYNFLWSSADDHADHQRRYTLNSLSKVLSESGFGIEYSTYFFSLLPLPIFLFRTIPYRVFNKKKTGFDDYQREHNNKGLSGRFVEKMLMNEVSSIRRGRKIRFGGSCLIVANKI